MHKKVAQVLCWEVEAMARHHTLERMAFLTLTFKGPAPTMDELQSKFNSFNTHIIRKRYEQSIWVVQRGDKNGRLHLHGVVVLPFDVRTNFPFEQVRQRNYANVKSEIRMEWAALRRAAESYGLGRPELLPIRTSIEGIGRYLGGYIKRHVNARLHEDKGRRLVRFCGYGPKARFGRTARPNFSWVSARSSLWRQKVGAVAKGFGYTSLDDFKDDLGPQWAFFLADTIINFDLLSATGVHVYGNTLEARADGHDVPDGIDGPVVVERQVGGRSIVARLDPIWFPKYENEWLPRRQVTSQEQSEHERKALEMRLWAARTP